MGTMTDAEYRVLQRSYDFYLNPNYVLNEDAASRREAIDEFIRVLPFERYEGDPLEGVKPARPDTTLPNVAFAPADTVLRGADWFGPVDTMPTTGLQLEATVDATYEDLEFFRIGTQFELDPVQRRLLDTHAAKTGVNLAQTMIRAASVIVARQLSMDAINNISDPNTYDARGANISYKMPGLAKLYDNGFGGGGGDPQVIKAPTSLALSDVRELIRQVAPSHDGFGIGPDALLMSRRARALLIQLERTGGTAPTFLPDRRSGALRYHFDGIPVYVGPVREDEDTATGSPAFLTTSVLYNKTSIYALRLGGPTGIRILHVDGESDNFGLQVESLAAGTTTTDQGFKIHGYYTWFIPERQSVARLWGIDVSSEA